MNSIREELLSSNEKYSNNFGSKGNLPIPPGKKTAILTCMDARLDPAGFAGIKEGDAHVIRNAGGRASDDAIRSLIISHKLLGTNQWFVIHHTDCGMETFSNEIIGDLLAENLETATIDHNGWKNIRSGGGSKEGRFINWLTISNQRESILEDISRIKEHPLVSDEVSVFGFLFDVKTGLLEEINA